MSRQAEELALGSFLDAAARSPCALIIEGEPGIGKTTLWLDALRRARQRGFRLLTTRAAAAESVLAYAGLADLLGDVDESIWSDLPGPQRLGLDAALLRRPADGADATDRDARAVAAGFVAVVERLAAREPVLIAVDDVQWLDTSSANVVTFAARRLAVGAALLCTTRIGEEPSGMQLQSPDALRRIRLQPLTVSQLHQVLMARLGTPLTRPTLRRVHEIAGGNPFYGLELAREIGASGPGAELSLPNSLSDVVTSRISNVGGEAALLAIASVPVATVQLVAQTVGVTTDDVIESLAEAEARAVVAIDGNRVRFTHPLLAHGVYTGAPARDRRAVHRRLAELVAEPELRARHLALSDANGDPQTIAALDGAAEIARARGAPAAAAELLELAIGLGAADPERRIRCATYYFDGGDAARARRLLETVVAGLPDGPVLAEALHQLGLVRLNDDSFVEAAELLEKGVGNSGGDIALRVRILISLSYALLNAGQPAQAYDRIEQAVADAERSGVGNLVSLSLGMRAMMDFMDGRGFDEDAISRAVDLEERESGAPVAFRPHVQGTLLRAWTGGLAQARDEMAAVGRECLAFGEEGELIFVAFHLALFDIWLGDLDRAAVTADETFDRALQLGGDFPMFIALTLRAAVDAYTGRLEEARRDLGDAIAAGQRCGSRRLAEWPATLAGFVEVSAGNYQAALDAIEPLLPIVRIMPDTSELIASSFVPEAVEAMIGLGRIDDAEPFVEAFERNGRRLDRPWTLAVGMRCRAMVQAARGEVAAATTTAEQAIVEHKRLPMPFERARTQLLLGRLQRRQRRWDAAPGTLQEALQTFEEIGAAVWAGHARVELERAEAGRHRAVGLSPTEQRVAELAASGMSNRDIATSLFVSPKTVETYLSRVYRKLKVRRRAELYRALYPTDPT